jgi:hypothetical protein
MRTTETLYSNVLGFSAIITTALIFAGMPLFYGLDTTLNIACLLGVVTGSSLTLLGKMQKNMPVSIGRGRNRP